ncbi:MAG: hypothetical protein PUB19_03845 [Lachnospiraceae bacterium]|nr:hypothetical protein [Lachnospiraceae bacterium]
MKLHKRILCGMLLCLCISLTGCGTTLLEMTEDEEEQVVLYAAKVVSKFNRAQDKGYSYVDPARRDSKKEQSEQNTSEEEQQTDSGKTLTEIIGIDGMTFTYQGYDVTETFATQDVAIPDADPGCAYLLLRIQAANISDKSVTVDLLNHPLEYGLSINDGEYIECTTTLSMDDLSTYYNKDFGPGTTDDVVLIFHTEQDNLQDITSLMLDVTVEGDMVYRIAL